MAEYGSFLRESVKKDAESIAKEDLRKVMTFIKLLADDPGSLEREKLTRLER